MGVTQLGYVGLGVSDMSAWEELVTGILGLEVSDRPEDGSLYLRMDDLHHRIVLHPDGTDDLSYVGWQVPTAAALRELEATLRDAGVRVEPADKAQLESRKVLGLINFEDPNGYRLEAFYGPLAGDRTFHPSRPISGFKTGELGLGHVVVVVNDMEETAHFYRDLLGFRHSDYSGAVAFFHCNPRHHSFACIAQPRPRRLSHVMIELNSFDDVGTAYDLCDQREVPIGITLGKHSNDHMTSFYLVTPSGFNIEYGYGARFIDDATWVVQRYASGDVWGHKRMPAPVAVGAST